MFQLKRFLVIQTAFIGDVILSTPIFSELKRIHPNAEIDVVVRAGNDTLLQNNPHINEIISWNKKQNKYLSLFQTIKKIRQKSYDDVFTLQRYHSASIMTFFALSKNKVGFDSAKLKWVFNTTVAHSLKSGIHEVNRNLNLIGHHQPNLAARPQLFPTNQDFEKIKLYQSKSYYCIAPASVWTTKQLPENQWKKLINALPSESSIYLLGSKSDSDLCQRLIPLNSKIENLAGKLSILESAALMKGAKMNFVNDSGPLHIASAMNAPVRAFFCSTVASFGFGPLSDDSKIVEVREKLACRPCGIHGHVKCPKGHFKCGNDINIQELVKEIPA